MKKKKLAKINKYSNSITVQYNKVKNNFNLVLNCRNQINSFFKHIPDAHTARKRRGIPHLPPKTFSTSFDNEDAIKHNLRDPRPSPMLITTPSTISTSAWSFDNFAYIQYFQNTLIQDKIKQT